MAKSLGQIHTVSNVYDNLAYSLASGNKLLVDLPGELTEQLQHMCRMMANYKVVGIDMSFGPIQNTGGVDLAACNMNGYIQYYTPTKGRVEACKAAYRSVRRMMKMQGINPAHAITYDFRPLIADPAGFVNGSEIPNQASIEDNGLATCLANGPGSSNVFGVYNQGIQPRATVGTSPNFEDGFDTGLRSNAASADFTLNEKVTLSALTAPIASEELEFIPFELSYTAAEGNSLAIATGQDMEWRPDPALYLSILTGQLIIKIDESQAVDDQGSDAMDSTELEIAVHVAGWKGFLGSNRKKRRSKRGKKHHGRKSKSFSKTYRIS